MAISYAAREIQRLAGKALHQYGMIAPGDRILVALSGGKDSLLLLDFLEERRRRAPIDYSLVAVHLDMGFEDPGQRAALEEYVAGKNLEYYFEVTDYAPVAHSGINRENPCFLCSRLRRRRLFELARDFGCPKIALGHHRDDLIETLLLNILFSGEISTMLPVQTFFNGLITVIRPLCLTPEDKIRRWTLSRNPPLVENSCPSAARSKRREIKNLIAELSRSNDKIKGNIFRALSNVRPDYLLGPARPSKPNPGRVGHGRDGVMEGSKKMAKKNQRSRQRVNFKTLVDLTAGEWKLEGLESRDISLKGLYVTTDQNLPVGTPVDITLVLSGTSSQLKLSMKGRVARAESGGLGVDFVEVDLDSFFHLRNIIAYNLGGTVAVDHELAVKPAFELSENGVD